MTTPHRHPFARIAATLTIISAFVLLMVYTRTGYTDDQVRALAEQGAAWAQFSLGVMYNTGEGVPQDDVAAVRWFRFAAERGDARGLGNLGRMYHLGRGIPQDDVEAHVWYTVGAERGGDVAREWAAEFLEELEARMTPDQLADAQRRAREWTPTHEP